VQYETIALLSSNSGYSRKQISLGQIPMAYSQALSSAPPGNAPGFAASMAALIFSNSAGAFC
jgi:hypothetical protein